MALLLNSGTMKYQNCEKLTNLIEKLSRGDIGFGFMEWMEARLSTKRDKMRRA